MKTPRADAEVGPGPCGVRTFRIYFVKPSKYDDEGYVFEFRWGTVPSHALIVLAGLNEAYARTRPEVAVQTVLWDEMVDGALSREAMAGIRERGLADGVELLIGIAGVQTNMYPRGRDLALQFAALGLPVVFGGFHVSTHPPSREFLVRAGITVVVGEAESTWADLLDDYRTGALRSCYQASAGVRARGANADVIVPEIEEAPLPAIHPRYLRGFFNPTFSTIDTSRGCPFSCTYCSVIGVMGRTMRAREPGRVVEWIRDAHDRHGVQSLFIVDDDFFRSPRWEAVLAGVAELRRGGRSIWLKMQADVAASADATPAPGEIETGRQRRSRRFLELAAAAGCYAVFIGFESFNPANLEASRKFHNEDLSDRRRRGDDPGGAVARLRDRYRRAVDNWHDAGVAVHAGYMIGLPFDDLGCGRRAARDLIEVGVDLTSFFAYLPLPGTEDALAAEAADAVSDHDFNNYDTLHFVARHPILTAEELRGEFRAAWRTFYGWRRVARSLVTLHRVPGLSRAARQGMVTMGLYAAYAYRRGWHPMLSGIWRLRRGAERREVFGDEEAYALYAGGRRANAIAGVAVRAA